MTLHVYQVLTKHLWIPLDVYQHNVTISGMGIQTFQQLTGINAVMFYCPVIFNSFLPPLEAIIANLVM